jgi:hypothetical protein
VTDLVQIIRPWVVVDVTPPAVGQAATSANASTAPSTLNIGKVVAPSSVQNTTGNYSYDVVHYMHGVSQEKQAKSAPDGPPGKSLGPKGVNSGQSPGKTDEDPNVKS